MLPFKQFRNDLVGDLSALGLSAQESNMLSESRISEQTYTPAQSEELTESTLEYSQSESPFVGQDLLNRIGALIDTDNLSSEDAQGIIEGLMEKAPETGCEDQYESIIETLTSIEEGIEEVAIDGNIEDAFATIIESLEAGEMSPVESFRVLSALIDAPLEEGLDDVRDEIIEAILLDEAFRKMLKKVKGAYKRVRVKVGTSAEKAKARMKYMKRRGKIKLQRAKRAKKATVKKASGMLKRARAKFGMESNDLASRLSNRALAESNGVHDEFNMVARIGRVFNELSHHVSEEVVAVMEEQFDLLRSNLCESNTDLESAVRPCIAVIAECMKEIEQGNC